MIENQDFEQEKNNDNNNNDKDSFNVDSERDYGSAILSIIRGDNDDELLRELRGEGKMKPFASFTAKSDSISLDFTPNATYLVLIG